MKNVDYKYKELVVQTIRKFFQTRNFTEIFVPILNDSIPLEPTIYPFETTWKTIHETKQYYLPTSPERSLKIALSEGVVNCFAIAPSFRNLEDQSPIHFPEFLMLEWYRKDAKYTNIMIEIEELFSTLHRRVLAYQKKVSHSEENNNHIQLDAFSWKRVSMQELWQTYAHINLSDCIDDFTMRDIAQKKGFSVKNSTWEQMFNQIFLNEIEPHIGNDPCFITYYPSKISPLCKPCMDDPQYAERFELYINGIEIGNGNTEETNDDHIRQMFHEEQLIRKVNHLEPPIDETFLGAIKKLQGTSYAGVGIGIERLMKVMI
jgi:elongation factor P--(R)-beta-lysine ligase